MAEPSPAEVLAGRRLLVVEDDYMIAQELRQDLARAGALVVGPVPTVAEALALVAAEVLDGAVLDVNLAGERAFAVADALRARSVPFMFATGYDHAAIPAAYADVPYSEKPAGARKVARALRLGWG
ncbi:response regulator [Roseomonas sp. WA12]